ncbi:MAG: guanylate kinase [Endomicrobiia bacterium]
MIDRVKKKIENILKEFYKKTKKGKVIVISGPSGVGKTTVCKELLKKDKNLVFSISYTTRPKKSKEKDKVDYYFVSEEKFLEMAKRGEFIEWAKVHNNYYGTPKKPLLKAINSGKDVLLDIDVQGGKNIKKIFPDGVFIFLLPPSWKVLMNRVISRKREDLKEISLRLKNILKEIKYIRYYDYIVINDNLGDTLKILYNIIKSHKYKIRGVLL